MRRLLILLPFVVGCSSLSKAIGVPEDQIPGVIADVGRAAAHADLLPSWAGPVMEIVGWVAGTLVGAKSIGVVAKKFKDSPEGRIF